MGKGNVVVPPGQVNDERTEDRRQQAASSGQLAVKERDVETIRQKSEIRHQRSEKLSFFTLCSTRFRFWMPALPVPRVVAGSLPRAGCWLLNLKSAIRNPT